MSTSGMDQGSDPPPFVPPTCQQTAASTEIRAEMKRRDWIDYVGLWVSIATLVFLGIYTMLTGFITYDSWTQITTASRAWLSPSFMVLGRPLEGGTVRFQLQVENFGRQPATDVTYRFRHFLTTYIAQDHRGEPKLPPNATCSGLQARKGGGFVVYPGKTNFWITSGFRHDAETKHIISAILDHRRSLIIEGCIAYRTFGARHTSAFRFFLRDIPGPSCWRASQGLVTPQGVMACWNFNGMRSGNGAN